MMKSLALIPLLFVALASRAEVFKVDPIVAAFRKDRALLVEFKNENLQQTFFWGTAHDLYQLVSAAPASYRERGAAPLTAVEFVGELASVHFTKAGAGLAAKLPDGRTLALLPLGPRELIGLNQQMRETPPRIHPLPHRLIGAFKRSTDGAWVVVDQAIYGFASEVRAFVGPIGSFKMERVVDFDRRSDGAVSTVRLATGAQIRFSNSSAKWIDEHGFEAELYQRHRLFVDGLGIPGLVESGWRYIPGDRLPENTCKRILTEDF